MGDMKEFLFEKAIRLNLRATTTTTKIANFKMIIFIALDFIALFCTPHSNQQT